MTGTISSADEFLTELPTVKNGKKGQVDNVCCALDIETTSLYENEEKRACMYAWCFGINGNVIKGRYWTEFRYLCDKLVKRYNITQRNRLIIYIHNLSYEFQFFKKLFEWETVFSLDTRKPVYAITKEGLEFRCSYILSNYSLEKVGENLLKYKVRKKVGDLDYNLKRHCETPITEKEWGYIINDVLVVMAYIQEEIERLGDITKLPLTNTGYVRQLCRDNCLSHPKNKYEYFRIINNLRLTVDDYKQCKRTYMGGFTHANYKYVGKEIKNVSSFDFSSSYPSVMIAEKYPMSRAIPYKIQSVDDFVEKLKKYCCMFDVRFYDIRSTVDFENYISLSRCSKIEHYIVNNGRIVEADMLEISVTEQDFYIIANMYKWKKMEIYNFKYHYKGYLPKEFITTILELYEKKTTLKGVEGKEAEYMHSKNQINSMYGMCVTDPCKDDIIYSDDMWTTKKADIYQLIYKYNTSPNRFLFYQWGIWVTAYARRNLFDGIFEFKDDYIYSDTDSIKVLNVDNHIDYIKNYNVKVQQKIENCLNYYNIPVEKAKPKTIKGIEKLLGVWDYEGTYTRFKTLGAKRYLIENENDIQITIAGVNKKSGIKYLRHKYKTNDKIFKEFEENLMFPATYLTNDGVEEQGSGKLTHTYIDNYIAGELIDYTGKKGYYNEQSFVHLENSEYCLSLDYAFKCLLERRDLI